MSMYGFDQYGLRTDVSGMPLDWISYREAARLYHLGLVAYSCGEVMYTVRGGVNARTGCRTTINVHSIIATYGEGQSASRKRQEYVPPLSNAALFARDARICMYCGESSMAKILSRDHVTPLSMGGADAWNNVVTACKRCNNFKAGRTPEQAGMILLAVPFTPTHAEFVFLRGRRVLADQMEFLVAHFPRTSPLHERLRAKYF